MAKFGRLCKEKMVNELEKKFKKYPDFIVANFSRLPTQDLNKFRTALKTVHSDYMVVKNSITKLVLKKIKLEKASDLFKNSSGIIFSGKDPILTSKQTVTFGKDRANFKICGGFIDGALVDANSIKELAFLPPREILLAILFGTMKSPVNGLVNVLSATLKSLLYALEAIRKKKE